MAQLKDMPSSAQLIRCPSHQAPQERRPATRSAPAPGTVHLKRVLPSPQLGRYPAHQHLKRNSRDEDPSGSGLTLLGPRWRGRAVGGPFFFFVVCYRNFLACLITNCHIQVDAEHMASQILPCYVCWHVCMNLLWTA